MSDTAEQAFSRALVQSLVGERGHLPIARALSDIHLKLAGEQVQGLPYTIYQLVSHMSYWQDFMLAHVRGEQPARPPAVADSWPVQTNAADEASWQVVLDDFLQGIDTACELARTLELAQPLAFIPTETVAGFLRNIASHNTYHLGEIVIIRRLLGSWPPPGGGFPA
ncbi:DinB family protein [Paenibacillus wenxiniae]|uniref:DinB family protein n=1 Tax=Paenibacillus wenxiniae TaxID=1636843 RepID=A0ABW4RF58_9BACL